MQCYDDSRFDQSDCNLWRIGLCDLQFSGGRASADHRLPDLAVAGLRPKNHRRFSPKIIASPHIYTPRRRVRAPLFVYFPMGKGGIALQGGSQGRECLFLNARVAL